MGSTKARNQRQAHKALLADQTYFHTLSVWENAQNGNQAGVAEIRRFQTVARLMQHMVSFQADKFELWQQLFLFTTRQAKQYLVMNVISVTIAAGCPRAGPCRRTNVFFGHWRLLAARCCLILQGTVTQWAPLLHRAKRQLGSMRRSRERQNSGRTSQGTAYRRRDTGFADACHGRA